MLNDCILTASLILHTVCKSLFCVNKLGLNFVYIYKANEPVTYESHSIFAISDSRLCGEIIYKQLRAGSD